MEAECLEKAKRETGTISLMRGWRFGGETEKWRSRKAKSLKSGEIRKGQLEGETERSG